MDDRIQIFLNKTTNEVLVAYPDRETHFNGLVVTGRFDPGDRMAELAGVVPETGVVYGRSWKDKAENWRKIYDTHEAVAAPADSGKCSCSLDTLMVTGCKCGRT